RVPARLDAGRPAVRSGGLDRRRSRLRQAVGLRSGHDPCADADLAGRTGSVRPARPRTMADAAHPRCGATPDTRGRPPHARGAARAGGAYLASVAVLIAPGQARSRSPFGSHSGSVVTFAG